MDLGLADRVYIVTGGSRGLGFATAQALVGDGAKVVVSARDPDSLNAAVKQLGPGAVAEPADLGDPSTPERLFARANAEFGRLDGALISVGGPAAGTVLGATDEQWTTAFESVFLGAVRLARTLSNELGEGGSLALVLSSSAKSPVANLAISNGLRPGLAMVAKSLADEVGPRGIRVNALLPGRIDTERVRELDALGGDADAARAGHEAGIPLRRYGLPAEFGRVGAFLLSPASFVRDRGRPSRGRRAAPSVVALPSGMKWRWFRNAERTPSALLLVLQLAAILSYPFLEGDRTKRAAFSLVSLVILFVIVYAVRHSPASTWIGLVLGAPVLVLLVALLITDDAQLIGWVAAFEAILYFYGAFALVSYMLADREISTDELFAAVATFTLVAWAFGYVYVVIQQVAPNSFIAAQHPEEPRTWVELLALSFTNITATGSGDVMPVRAFARSVVMIEQVVGVLYVAMVVARVVGLTVARLLANTSGTKALTPESAGSEPVLPAPAAGESARS